MKRVRRTFLIARWITPEGLKEDESCVDFSGVSETPGASASGLVVMLVTVARAIGNERGRVDCVTGPFVSRLILRHAQDKNFTPVPLLYPCLLSPLCYEVSLFPFERDALHRLLPPLSTDARINPLEL